MRLKTLPRRRRPYALINDAQEQIRSTDITRDVTKKNMSIAEYSRSLESLKKPEAKMRLIPEAIGALDQRQLDTGKFVQKIGTNFNTNNQETETLEAVDLSIQNNLGAVGVEEETVSGSSSSNRSNSSDKFAGSLLYQIMIDPTFVENIKNTKNIKNLTCKFCKEQFVSDDALGKHLDARLNELDHITCCACGKTFGQKRYLRYHQRCHVKKNQFTCGICTKIYSRMDNLTRHKAYHTNPDKYPCTMCKKAFSRRDLMMKHLKSHQGKKMNCDLCKGVFAGLAEMEAHRIALHLPKNKN